MPAHNHLHQKRDIFKLVIFQVYFLYGNNNDIHCDNFRQEGRSLGQINRMRSNVFGDTIDSPNHSVYIDCYASHRNVHTNVCNLQDRLHGKSVGFGVNDLLTRSHGHVLW